MLQQHNEEIKTNALETFAGERLPALLEATAAICTVAPEIQASASSQTSENEAALDQAERGTIDIPRLRRKLPRRSFLRRANIQWDAPLALPDANFAALLNKLRDPNPAAWRERMLCAWLLSHAPLTPDQAQRAAQALAGVAQNRHASRRQRFAAGWKAMARQTAPFATAYTIALSGWILSLILRGVNAHAYPLPFHIVYLGVCFCILGAMVQGAFTVLMSPVWAALNADRGNRVRRQAILSLGRIGLAASVEPLTRAALDISPGIRAAAETALPSCLSALTPACYEEMGTRLSPLLCSLLNRNKERLFANHVKTERLVLDVLEALGHVGTGMAAAHAAAVAEDGWTQNVREAAQSILPLLQERHRQESDPYILLRAAAPSSADASQMLRAAASPPDSAPEQLLRPSAN